MHYLEPIYHLSQCWLHHQIVAKLDIGVVLIWLRKLTELIFFKEIFAGGIAQLAECLPSMHKALGSIPTTT